jgi:hypothetical protein
MNFIAFSIIAEDGLFSPNEALMCLGVESHQQKQAANGCESFCL